jgi:hypothetical protein
VNARVLLLLHWGCVIAAVVCCVIPAGQQMWQMMYDQLQMVLLQG